MGELVAQLGAGRFVLWSNTVDAPTSTVLGRWEIMDEVRKRHGVSTAEAENLVTAAEANGTSDPHVDLDDLLHTNRAGPNGERLTVDEILEQYG